MSSVSARQVLAIVTIGAFVFGALSSPFVRLVSGEFSAPWDVVTLCVLSFGGGMIFARWKEVRSRFAQLR